MEFTILFHSYVKLALILLSAVVFITILWYALFRLFSADYAVNSYRITLEVSDAAAKDSLSLNIGSYNIAHARGGLLGASNWRKGTDKELLQHLDKIALLIKEAQLDIVILNEIDFSSVWSFHINQASYIASQAGYSYVVEQRNMDVTFPFVEFKFGNAILSRHPIIQSDSIVFEPYSQWEAIFVGNHNGVLSRILTPRGEINVVAVHLEYRSEEIRVKAANQLRTLARNSPVPFIAAGDFNSTPVTFPGAQKTITGLNAINCLLGEHGFRVPPEVTNRSEYFTFPSQQSEIVIDWILVKGNLEILDGRVVQSNLSDHFLVTSALNLAEGLQPASWTIKANEFGGAHHCN